MRFHKANVRRALRLLLPCTAILAVALCLYGLATSSSIEKCIGQQGKYHGSQQEIEGSTLLIVRSVIRCTGGFLNHNSGGIQAVSAMVVALFTVILTLVTNRQARITKEAFITNARAFVSAKGFEVIHERKQDGLYHWRFRAVWENTGNTPTKNMTIQTSCDLRNSLLPASFVFACPADRVGPGHISPKESVYGGAAPQGHWISPHDILDVQAGQKFLYLWGWAKYWDVFPETPQHTTLFCWRINADGDPRAFDPAANNLHFHRRTTSIGNCADEECYRQGYLLN